MYYRLSFVSSLCAEAFHNFPRLEIIRSLEDRFSDSPSQRKLIEPTDLNVMSKWRYTRKRNLLSSLVNASIAKVLLNIEDAVDSFQLECKSAL